jgi:hypothetical protein
MKLLAMTALLVSVSALNTTCTASKSLWTNDIFALRGGKNVSFDSFAGKVGLAINVASF